VRTILALAFALALPGLPPLAAGEPEALAGVQRWLDGTKDLQGRFEQTLVSSALGVGPRESGRLFLRRPGRMRWEYTQPEAKIALVVDERTEIYLAEERRLHRAVLSEDDTALASLLSGTRPLASVFHVTALPAEAGRARLKLVPRTETSGVREIVLALEPGSFAVSRVETLDQGGNRMAYVFSGLRRNAGIRDEVFRFTPPKGTEVVDGL
jgi:outer membrane lipoprotein carrier protein